MTPVAAKVLLAGIVGLLMRPDSKLYIIPFLAAGKRA